MLNKITLVGKYVTLDRLDETHRSVLRTLSQDERISTEEGILRQHIILDDGFTRDTVVYSILKSEWLTVLASLERRLLDHDENQLKNIYG